MKSLLLMLALCQTFFSAVYSQPGLLVQETLQDAISGSSDANLGVRGSSASNYGVFGTSSNSAGGAFRSTTSGTPDLEIIASGPTAIGDDCTISSDRAFDDSDLILEGMDNLVIQIDKANAHTNSVFQVRNGDGTVVFSVDESGDVTKNGATLGLDFQSQSETVIQQLQEQVTVLQQKMDWMENQFKERNAKEPTEKSGQARQGEK
ncbi:MAG: hypothetical protein IPL46_16215 [Saprospiraceae bacterium]|nr:hypothetical protein [Saprospiraceae bacterium]